MLVSDRRVGFIPARQAVFPAGEMTGFVLEIYVPFENPPTNDGLKLLAGLRVRERKNYSKK